MKGHSKKAFFILTGCLLFVYSSFAQFEVTVGETRSTSEETMLNFSLTDYKISSTTIDNQVCDFISLSDAAYFETKGMPMLPYISKSIVIPGDASMGVEVINISFKEVKVNKLLPSRGVIYRNQNPATILYTFDDFYSRNAWFPTQTVSLDKPYILRNMRGIVVRFYPFQYNPAKGILRVAESISVKVKRIGKGKINVLNLQNIGISSSFDIFYNNHFLNYNQIKTRYDFVEDGESMIIISASDFKSAMEPLVAWKNQKGIKTELFEYPSGTGGSGTDAIKSFIKGKFNSDKITYVILVGDLDEIPSPSGGGGKSDPSYALVAGSDNYVDLFVSRFSVSSSSDVQNMVNNSLKYEKEPEENAGWYAKAIGMGSSEGNPPDYEWMNDFRDMLLAYNYTEVDKIYQGQGGTTSQATNALEEGRSWFNYMGHGSSGSFGFSGARFSNSTWKSLNNTGKLPVMISVACNNGQFDKSDCIAEDATVQPNKGALAFLGSWISQPWKPPQHGQKEMVRLITTDNCISIGGIIYNGMAKILDQSSSSSYRNTYLTWILFGDPSVMLFTDAPKALNATYPQVVGTGPQDIDVSFGESIDGRVCVYSEKYGILGSKILSNSSSAKIAANIEDDDEKVLLTITGRNKMPFIKEIEVNSGPYLRVSAPINGDSFFAGTKTNVTWKTGGGANVANVKIEYSTNNGSSFTVIVASTANNNTYEWTVPDVNESDQCVVKVSEVGGNLLGTSGVFSIKQKAAIALSPASLSASASAGQSVDKNLKVENKGKGKLTYSIEIAGSKGNIMVNELYVSESAFYDGFELWNKGPDQDMTGWKAEWKDNQNTSGTYSFQSGFILKAGKTVVIMDESGSANDSTIYMGGNLYWDRGSTELSLALLDAEGKGVDFVRSSGNNDTPPTGTSWSGTGVGLTADYVFRKQNKDSDNASDWSASATGTQNKINPGQSIGNTSGWLSVVPKEGTVNGLQSVTIKATFNATGLAKNVYYDTLIISHNSADITSPIRIPCQFNVDMNSILNARQMLTHFDMRYHKSKLYYHIPDINERRLHVTVGLYNVQGKLIRKLVDEAKGPGFYFVTLDNNGSQLASGIYLGKMEAADFRKTIKIIKK